MPNQPFRPSRDGLPYTNAWPSQAAVVVPTPFGELKLGNAAGGLCGGMVFASLDYWHAAVPPATVRPSLGETVYSYLVRRLVDSWHVPTGVAQYFQWMKLPDDDRTLSAFGRRIVLEQSISTRTVKGQWPQIAGDLDRGTPAALGLVTIASTDPRDLGANHQVLAYGYDRTGNHVRLHVYDPNRGQRDDIWIDFDISPTGGRTVFTHNLALSRPIRGFFRTPYAPVAPPAR